MKNNLILTIIVVISTVIRLIVFPYAQATHPDAVSRIIMAETWLDNPYLIIDGVWLPFHHYINALAIWISGEHVFGPILIHILFASLTAIPIYFFTRREMNPKLAWFAATVYVFEPIIFRNSFSTLAEIPFAFFLACSLNFLSKSIREKNIKYAVLAGLSMTITAGFRYEAWVLIIIFCCIAAFFKSWKILTVFLFFAITFPIFWMTGNYVVHLNIFYGINENDEWLKSGIKSSMLPEEKLKNVLFYLMSWIVNFSPVLLLLITSTFIKRTFTRQLRFSKLIWFLPFFFLLALYSYKTFQGTLLIQHRFTVSLIVLSAPLASLIFEKDNFSFWKKMVIALVITSLLPMSYLWMKIPFERVFPNPIKIALRSVRYSSMDEFEAIPRLDDQSYVDVKNEIKKNLKKQDGLILDFISWNKTYYLSLESALPYKQIFITNPLDKKTDALIKMLNDYPEGVIVLHCYSPLSEQYTCKGDQIQFKFIPAINIQITPVTSTLCVGVFRYRRLENFVLSADSTGKCIIDFPEKYSKQYYMHTMRLNLPWYSDIRRKADEKNISVEEMMEMDAEFIIENSKEQMNK